MKNLKLLVFSVFTISAVFLIYTTLSKIHTNAEIADSPELEITKKPISNKVVVKLEENVSASEKESYIKSLGNVKVNEIKEINSIIVEHPEHYDSAQITQADVIAQGEEDFYAVALEGEPNDPDYRYQWQFKKYPVLSAWPKQTNSVIAVIDSGACFNHPDLQGKFLSGKDYVRGDNYPEDENGHGCAVSGVIAANTNNHVGVAAMNPKAKIMPLKVLNSNGIGSYTHIAQAIIYATDHGANVINLSLGGTGSPQFLKDAVNYARSKGVIVVAAAGNSNQNGALYPAKYENVVAVGALNDRLEKATFSNYGKDIDVWAPGEKVYTTTRDGRYINKKGTSYAAPHVSALGAAFFSSDDEDPQPAPPVHIQPIEVPDDGSVFEINERFNNLSGWSQSGSTSLQVTNTQGVLRVRGESAGGGSKLIMSQFVKVENRKNYYFKMDAYTSNANDAKLHVNFYDANFNLLGTAKTINSRQANTDWYEYKSAYYVPEEFANKEVEYARVVLEAGSKFDDQDESPALTFFDNVYFSKTSLN